jgi:Phage protein Gp138 N-terminal domain
VDRRERIADDLVAMRAFFRGRQASIWTMLPAILQSYNAAVGTCTAQPAIQAKYRAPNSQVYTDLALPLCVDCPVWLPRGGGYSVQLPLKSGDEGCLFFASRCIDSWWQNGGTSNPQAEMRLHDLSDGFFFPGASSQAKLPSGAPSSTAARLSSDDGETYIEVDNVLKKVNVVATAGLWINGVMVTVP